MDTEYIIIALVVAAIGYAIFEDRKKKSSSKSSKTPASPSKVKSRREMGPGPGARNRAKAPTVAELKKLTKQQLLDLADKNSIKVKRSGSKAEVVKAIAEQK